MRISDWSSDVCSSDLKPIDNDAKKEDKADAAAGGNDIAKSTGLKTEKEQASYMFGMSVGKSLEPIKDEVDVDTVVKAMKTVMSGGEPLLDDEQAQLVTKAFDKRLQAKPKETQHKPLDGREATEQTYTRGVRIGRVDRF